MAALATRASRAINANFILRNWLIGLHVVDHEQRGTNRAEYEDRPIERLSRRLRQAGISRTEVRELRHYRQFCVTYPEIRESLTPDLVQALLSNQVAASIGRQRVPELSPQSRRSRQ